MIAALRRTFRNPVELTMTLIGAMTFGFGMTLLNPKTDTFGGIRSYDVMARYMGEAQWGVIITLVGTAMLIGWYFWCGERDAVDRHNAVAASLRIPARLSLRQAPAFAYCTAIWAVGAGLWFIVAASFFIANPGGTGSTTYMIVGFGGSVVNGIGVWRTGRDDARAWSPGVGGDGA